MGISGGPVASGDWIYNWMNGFASQVARLAHPLSWSSYLESQIFIVIKNYQRRRKFLKVNYVYDIEIEYESQWINPLIELSTSP